MIKIVSIILLACTSTAQASEGSQLRDRWQTVETNIARLKSITVKKNISHYELTAWLEQASYAIREASKARDETVRYVVKSRRH